MDGLDIAEEAYAAINQPDKVSYIQHIKGMSQTAQQLAGIALLSGSMNEAETILLHNGLVYQAISINIQMHNWNRALELAVKHKTHVDTVLFLRQNYLRTINKDENNNKFIKLRETVGNEIYSSGQDKLYHVFCFQIPLDESKINEKIRLEKLRN